MKQSILDLPFDLKLSQDPRTQTSFICIVFIIIIVTIIIIIIIIIIIFQFVYLKFFW